MLIMMTIIKHRDYHNHNDYNLIDLIIIGDMIIMNHKNNDYHVDHTFLLLLLDERIILFEKEKLRLRKALQARYRV